MTSNQTSNQISVRRSTFDLVAVSGGIAFTVLALSTVAVAPAAPSVHAPAAEVRDYLVTHHHRFGLATAIMALAVLAVSLCFGYIHQLWSAPTGIPHFQEPARSGDAVEPTR